MRYVGVGVRDFWSIFGDKISFEGDDDIYSVETTKKTERSQSQDSSAQNVSLFGRRKKYTWLLAPNFEIAPCLFSMMSKLSLCSVEITTQVQYLLERYLGLPKLGGCLRRQSRNRVNICLRTITCIVEETTTCGPSWHWMVGRFKHQRESRNRSRDHRKGHSQCMYCFYEYH